MTAGPGDADALADHDEDAGADDRPDPHRGQLHTADRRFSSCPDSCVSCQNEETSRIAKMPGRPDGVGFRWPVVGSISTTSGGRRQCMRAEGTPDARRAP